MARRLDVPVVAGGCATGADFELLLELGCDFGQGAVVARPMAAAQVADWATSWTPPLPEDRQ